MKQIQATVHGRVHGVFFRQHTRMEAQRLGLKGWVRNEPDGTVRVAAVGAEDILKEFIEFLHRGSPGAQVSQVDVDWSDAAQDFAAQDFAAQDFKGFDVRW